MQIYRSENRRNNIINGGEKKERFVSERGGEGLADGQQWKRGVNSGRVNSQGVFASVRLRSCDEF